MKQEIIKRLEEIVGQNWVDTDPERVISYSKEQTNNAYGLVTPQPVKGSVIVKPAGAKEIAEVLKYANQELIKVIPKGAGTGLSANAIPTEPSIILSVERLNKMLEVDEENLMVSCEAAVTLGDLIEELKKNDKLYFPLHPGDEGAQVGGMVAMNAGGVRAVKHGIMRDQVKGLEAVLPTGEIVSFGGKFGKLLKNNAGYDLMQLLIGSEGTLGIITKVVLKLYPEPKATGTLIIPYQKRRNAFQTVPKILQEGIIPMAIEYMEKEEIEDAVQGIGKEWPSKEGSSYLMVILAEDKEDTLYDKAEVIGEICEEVGAGEILIAETNAEQQSILEIRSHVLPAIAGKIVDSPDVTVPRSKLAEYLDQLDQLAEEYNTKIPVIAHAGDGNLHPIILKEEGEVPAYYDQLKEKIYQVAVDLGGTVTGEHGVGMLRLKFLPLQLGQAEQRIMWKIKEAFDPNEILNPGKAVVKVSN
ncbi:FAD-binding oxidoreductase [Natroniella sulfidigena]|uniref:FAD-binding oxidoreductase n=1 Tax=Natroniella sulfidigena TaxID=723921 RepID=UPI002009F820|nr:FAD-binding oxidoreductase [Natroniella sulfidigena]MCK8816879.1 FAD-binding oxidoreductase [Natroniella sulfidigena]